MNNDEEIRTVRAELREARTENARLREVLAALDANLQQQQWAIRVSLGTLKR